MSFTTDMTAWARKTKLTADQAVRTVGIEIYKQLGENSPVDTGQFRNSWNPSIGSPDTGLQSAAGGAWDFSKAERGFASVKAGDTMFVSNGQPYALRLAFGWSAQASGGWVERAVERVRRGLV